MVYLLTLIYHTNQLNVGKYARPMDALGSVDFFFNHLPHSLRSLFWYFVRGGSKKKTVMSAPLWLLPSGKLT